MIGHRRTCTALTHLGIAVHVSLTKAAHATVHGVASLASETAIAPAERATTHGVAALWPILLTEAVVVIAGHGIPSLQVPKTASAVHADAVGWTIQSSGASSELTTVEPIAQSHAIAFAETTSMIPAPTAIHPPTMTATVLYIKVWTTEEEVVAMRITGIDAEVPETARPIKRTVEIAGCAKGIVLPIPENIAQVEVTLPPIYAIKVVVIIDTHEIIEVNLISSLVLVISKIQFVCHLIREEECLLASLLIAHGMGRYCHYEQSC